MKGLILSLMVAAAAGFTQVSRGADFDGDSRSDIAIFRPSTGLWSIRGITRIYFGGSDDSPVAGDFNGDGIAEAGVFRKNTGLWAIRGTTRVYFGNSSDTPIQGGGGGQVLYDYVVKWNDGTDLVRALESDTYRSVFIPAGTYPVSETINVEYVQLITGGRHFASIDFIGEHYLSIEAHHCVVERIRVRYGGTPAWYGNFVINGGDYVTIRDCRSVESNKHGFDGYGISGSPNRYATFINCMAKNAAASGFRGNPDNESTRLIACVALGSSKAGSGYSGFYGFYNLSGCYVDGKNLTGGRGFQNCYNLSSCQAVDCHSAAYESCQRLSACTAVGGGSTSNYGFNSCRYLAACYASGCTHKWNSNQDTAACNDYP